MTTDQWYIKTASGKRGPYSTADLQRYVDAGAIRPNVGIGDGEGRWKAAAAIEGLQFSDETIAKFKAGKRVSRSPNSAESGIIRRADRGDQVSEEQQRRASELDEREASVQHRETELDRREQALGAGRSELDARAGQLDSLREQLEQDAKDQRQAAEEQRQAAEEQQTAVERDQSLLDREQALDESEQSVHQREQMLGEREQRLESRETEIDQTEDALKQRGQELDDREQTLEQRHELLEKRELALEEGEQAAAEDREQHQSSVESLERREAACKERELEFAERQSALDDRDSDLDQLGEELQGLTEELQVRADALDAREEQLATRERELADQLEPLTERESVLSERERTLSEREDLFAAKEKTLETSVDAAAEAESLLERIDELELQLELANKETPLESGHPHADAALDTRVEELVRQETDFVDRVAKLEASEAEIESAAAANQTRGEELDQRQTNLDERDREMEVQEADFEQREQSLREREQNLQRDEVALEEQGTLLAEREKEIAGRHEELMQRKLEVELQTSPAGVSTDADLEVRRLQSSLTQIETELETVRRQLAEREDELSSTRATLGASRSSREEPGDAGDARSEKNRLLAEFAERQESLARRETELNRREAELTKRELSIIDDPPDDYGEEGPSGGAPEPERQSGFGTPVSGPSHPPMAVVETPRTFGAGTVEPAKQSPSVQPDSDAVADASKRLAEFRSSIYEQRFGPCDEYFPDDDTKMRVDVSVHLPGGSRDFATMVTNGMSDYPIPMPNGQRSVRAEILLYVTHIDELAIRIMRSAAKIPYRKKQGLSIGTTGELGDQELLRSCNQKDCVYMLPVVEADSKPIAAKEHLGASIQLFWLVTITPAERRLIESSGIHRFLSLLEKNNHAVFFDMTRDCYAKRRSWFRR
ncbi:MAG: suppressor of fused domain protein [Planctomycetota bacterium]